jgi:hypothetical protein
MPSQGWTHCVVIQESSKATWLAIGCSMYAKDDQPVTFALDEWSNATRVRCDQIAKGAKRTDHSGKELFFGKESHTAPNLRRL